MTSGLWSWVRDPSKFPYFLSVFIPVAAVLSLTDSSPTLTFIVSALAVIPAAALMGRATEELAGRAGPGIGGLLNVTFGNAPELLIAIFALNRGLQEVVKASLIGSILGNILLVLGAAMLVGGRKRVTQYFDRTAASSQSSMLLLCAAALLMPALYALIRGHGLPSPTSVATHFSNTVQTISVCVAVVLILSYIVGLVFSLRTHRDIFNPRAVDQEEQHWSVRKSVALLALAGVLVGVMSEILVGSIAHTATNLGISQFFIGVIVVAVVGNAAEHWSAIYFAARDRMDLAVNIAIGSSAQVALFVVPILVFVSYLVGPFPLALVFNGFELVALLVAVVIANNVTQEGESNWFEGFQLLAVYAVLAITFFFVR